MFCTVCDLLNIRKHALIISQVFPVPKVHVKMVLSSVTNNYFLDMKIVNKEISLK